MARSLNKAQIIGRLGQDPEVRNTPSNIAVCNFSVATSDVWTDKQTGEKREKTEWHRCVAWGKTGEIIGQYVKKGQRIYVEGRIETRKWTGNDGQDRYTTEIRVSERDGFVLLDGGGQAGGPTNEQRNFGNENQGGGGGGQQNFDDQDIPFAPYGHRSAGYCVS